MFAASKHPTQLLLSLGVGAGVVAACFWCYKRWRSDPMPTKWRRVGTLEEILLFPIKSCGALQYDTTEKAVDCELLGLEVDGIPDRALMLIDERDKMVDLRVYPKMVLIECKHLGPAKLQISAPGMESIILDLQVFARISETQPQAQVKATLWVSKVKTVLCGKVYDEWFSMYALGKSSGLRLVYYALDKPTKTYEIPMRYEPNITKADGGALSNSTSYHLLNMASMEDLNSRNRLNGNEIVDAVQFRGNFHVLMDTPQAYAEDNWQWIKIGEDAVFRNVAPCGRCIVPNVNIKGERNLAAQPLRILKTYRKLPSYKSPPFGIHLGLRRRGTIKPHDVVYVEDV